MANGCFGISLRYLHGQWTSANEARVLLYRYTVCYLSFPLKLFILCGSVRVKSENVICIVICTSLAVFVASLFQLKHPDTMSSFRTCVQYGVILLFYRGNVRTGTHCDSFLHDGAGGVACSWFLFSMCVHVYMSVPLVTRCEVYCCSQRCVFVFFSNVMMELIYKLR